MNRTIMGKMRSGLKASKRPRTIEVTISYLIQALRPNCAAMIDVTGPMENKKLSKRNFWSVKCSMNFSILFYSISDMLLFVDLIIF